MKVLKSQHGIGTYVEHYLADKAAVNNLKMRLLLFCNEHGVALDNYNCLVKCVKESCPDSQVADSVL